MIYNYIRMKYRRLMSLVFGGNNLMDNSPISDGVLNIATSGSQTAVLEKPETSEIETDAPELDFRFYEKPVFGFFKRLGDVFLSLISLIVLSPVFLVFSVVIFIKDPGSPFFSQNRVGKDGKIFRMYKFRSMYKDAEERKAELMELNEDKGAFFKINDDPRILGKIGKFIRKSSIDELPQLINILKGDMSIVGPRPFIPEEQERLPEERLLVRPGLSCYWQINGKNSLSASMSNYYDLKYIMDRSVVTDIKIIIKTFAVVFTSSNS